MDNETKAINEMITELEEIGMANRLCAFRLDSEQIKDNIDELKNMREHWEEGGEVDNAAGDVIKEANDLVQQIRKNQFFVIRIESIIERYITEPSADIHKKMAKAAAPASPSLLARYAEDFARLESAEYYLNNLPAILRSGRIENIDQINEAMEAAEVIVDNTEKDLIGDRLGHNSTNVYSNAANEVRREVASRLYNELRAVCEYWK